MLNPFARNGATFLDTIDRADGDGLGVATNLQAWTGADWRRVSGEARPPTGDGDHRTLLETGITINAVYDFEFTSADAANRTSAGVILKALNDSNLWLVLIANQVSESSGVFKLFERADGNWDGAPNDPGSGSKVSTFGANVSMRGRVYSLETGFAAFRDGEFLFYFQMSSGKQTTYLTASQIGLRAAVGASIDNATSRFSQIVGRPLPNWRGHSGPPLPVVYITDMSADEGDANATAGGCVLHRLGCIQILAIACSTSNTKAPGCIAALLKFYGVTGVQLGTWKGAAFDPEGELWAAAVYDAFPRDPDGVTVGLASTVADADTVLAAVLAARTAADVHIIELGPLNVTSQLLDDHPALCATKVARLHVMGGKYPTNAGDAEWNFLQDPAAAANVAANWPTEIGYQGFEVGEQIIVGLNHASKTSAHPLYVAADVGGSLVSGRPAWDDFTVLDALFGPEYGDVIRVRGSNSVNASTGKNTFTPSAAGKDYYVIKGRRNSEFVTLIDKLLDADPNSLPAFP